MHEKKKHSILNKIVGIIENTPKNFSKNDYGNWRCLERRGIIFDLAGDSLDTYNDVLRDILNQERWGEKFSEKYVDKILKNLLFDIIEFGTDIAKENFDSICYDAESYSTEQVVYVPLGGISMYGVEELNLGRIQFKKITRVILEEILEATRAILKTTKVSFEEQQLFIEETEEDLSEKFLDKVCATCRVIAEPKRAQELAEQETQRALDLLRCSIPVLYKSQENIKIDLLPQVPSSFQSTLVLSSSGYVLDRTRLNRNYELSPANLEVLEKIGVFEVSKILQKSYTDLNDYEKTLLRGIHWFASSQTQVEIENEFLNLITCLETFFTREKGEPISNSIAEGIAFVLAKDLTKRKKIKQRIKCLHGMRSEVSHGGHSNILNKDIQELRSIATNLLIKMIEKQSTFTSRSDLLNWLEDQKLS